MARPRGTDGSLLRSLPWTMGAMSFALLPHVLFMPFWVSAAMLLACIWRYSIERHRSALPNMPVRAILALACFLGIFFTYNTISGVGPGSALLSVMAAMKLLETRSRRDQFVLLFIALFLTMSALLREQYLWSLPYLLLSLTLTLTAWLRMSADPDERPTQSARTSLRLIGYAVPVAIAMWIFFPRIATPFWSVPIDTGTAISGLSNNMSPGDISSLSLSNAVAFRANFEGRMPVQKDLYWRGIVMNDFNGRSWKAADEPFRGRPVRDQLDVFGEPTAYRVTLEPTNQQYLFALDMPYRWELNERKDSFMGREQQLAFSRPIDKRMAYEVISFTEYRAETDISDWMFNRTLNAKELSNPRTVALAREMREQAADDQAFIRAVLDRFANEAYFYTLEPPILGQSPVDKFMFETRQGFCEHYASAFAVMMRAAGIPARVVLGYQGGEVNTVGEEPYLIVRQADAHAWNEVWLEGIGWRRVDPTAAVAPERIDVGRSAALFDGIAEDWGMTAPSQWLYRIQQNWDYLNARWNDWVLGYGPDKQRQFMQTMGMDNPDWRRMMLTLVALVAILVFIASVFMTLRNRPPPADEALKLYRRFVRKTGESLQHGETPEAFARRLKSRGRLDAASVDELTETYLRVRYGDTGMDGLPELKDRVKAFAA
ncbi:MAG: DUF3488 and transglutaminase-like domain-containing protein [Pseudomonadota bacterium]